MQGRPRQAKPGMCAGTRFILLRGERSKGRCKMATCKHMLGGSSARALALSAAPATLNHWNSQCNGTVAKLP